MKSTQLLDGRSAWRALGPERQRGEEAIGCRDAQPGKAFVVTTAHWCERSAHTVAVKELVDYFARYLYLPRVAGPEVLAQAIRDGIALLDLADR
jgi:hypothetical protein